MNNEQKAELKRLLTKQQAALDKASAEAAGNPALVAAIEAVQAVTTEIKDLVT